MRKNQRKKPDPNEKLVSVICRTTNRSELSQALESVAKQTYRPLEILLVDAFASGSVDHGNWSGDVPIKLISLEKPLTRSQAANAGIDNSSGHYLMFLDEDDWVSPEHIANLVALLATDKTARAAYSSTQKTDISGNPTAISFRIAYDPVRLMQDNFIPIHCVVFEKSLTDQGCRFDESLAILEDWDFWLQVSQATHFLYLDQLTAFYREGGDSQTTLANPRLRYEAGNPVADARALLFDKWRHKWSGEQLDTLFGSLDMQGELDLLDGKLVALDKQLGERDKQLVNLNSDLVFSNGQLNERQTQLNRTLADIENLKQSIDSLEAEFEQSRRHNASHIASLEAALDDMRNSFSWKITEPYRWLRRQFDRRIRDPLKFRRAADKGSGIVVNKVSTDNALSFAFDSLSRIVHENLTIRGWAVGKDRNIKITACIDAKEYRSFSPTLRRQDIERIFPQLEGALFSGFDETIVLNDLPGGEHQLRLVIETSSGLREEITVALFLFHGNELYNAWLKATTPTESARQRMANSAAALANRPAVHVILAASLSMEAMQKTLNSLFGQVDQNWICHLIGTDWDEIVAAIPEPRSNSLNDRLVRHGDIQSALESIRELPGSFVCPEPGVILMPHALRELETMLASNAADIVYSDHDDVDAEGEHDNPSFTPCWSREHLYSRNYIGSVYLARNSLLSGLDNFQFAGSWRYHLLLNLSAANNKIDRVAKILWSQSDCTDASGVRTCNEEVESLQAFISENQIKARVRRRESGRNLDWEIESAPKVSIIIPTTGKLGLLKPCIESLLHTTDYPDFEIIMLDNSRGKNPEGIAFLRSKKFTVVVCDEDFNWARLNNIGVQHASGEIFLFLNDDIEVIEKDWLREMVKQASRDDIGAVGGLLLYPGGAIQHAGVFLVNHGGGCVHLFHKMMPGQDIYQGLDTVVREVTANTGACLMVSRDKFQAIGGFDEELAVVGNDIDLCLRLLDKGYRNIWTPECKLIHHESVSRQASVPREDELGMWKRWKSRFEAGDTYYNPNLSLNSVNFALNTDGIEDLISQTVCSKSETPTVYRPAPLLPGVNLIAYIRAEMGLGEAARSDARALTAAGIDFGIINFEKGNPARMTDLSWRHKEFSNPIYDVNLIHINADHILLVMDELPNYFFGGRYNIGYWAWELQEFPDEWLTAFANLDEVWVPSDFVRQAVAAKSPIPVTTIPHCIDIKIDKNMTREELGLGEEAFLFLSMFDTHSVAARKNPFGAIDAFKKAFEPQDNSVCLVLKANNPDPEDLQVLRDLTRSHSNIVVLDQPFKRQEIIALLGLVDCYVSLHRSEGFGLPPAEAMYLGKAVIITNWSGSTEYTSADNCLPIDYSLTPIATDLGPYKAGQVWATPDIDQAAAAMKRLVAEEGLADNLGRNAQKTIEDSFSPAAIGELIRARLAQIDIVRAERKSDLADVSDSDS